MSGRKTNIAGVSLRRSLSLFLIVPMLTFTVGSSAALSFEPVDTTAIDDACATLNAARVFIAQKGDNEFVILAPDMVAFEDLVTPSELDVFTTNSTAEVSTPDTAIQSAAPGPANSPSSMTTEVSEKATAVESGTKSAEVANTAQTQSTNSTEAPVVALGFPVPALVPQLVKTATEAVPSESNDGPVVIDNDEAQENQQTLKYEELATDEQKTRVKVGARFPVVISAELNSKTAKKGEPFEGRLKYDLKIGDRVVAKRGSVVNGHITYALKARSAMHSLVSPERWYRNSGCIGIAFDEIINERGEHLPLVATPAQKALIIKNKNQGRVLGVNHNGEIAGPWSQQLRYKAVRIGLNAAMAPVGVFSFGAMPAALGVMGAINPSFAFMKPVGQNVRHRRVKGFVWGALSGVPGSWLIEDTIVKGQEAVIKPGDEFLAEFKEEFTGEPATEANLLPGASAKVHGQVLPGSKKKK